MSSSEVRGILCLGDPHNPQAQRARRDLAEKLSGAGFRVYDAEEAVGDYQLVLLLGGDGFLLESLHALDFPSTPVLGVNFGSVGFLMNTKACLSGLLAALQAWRFRSEELLVLEAEAELEDGSNTVLRAVNDFVIERLTGQALRLRFSVDGRFFNQFSGDGLVFATPAGSTAYNLAAGGPVLHPEMRGIVVTPLYPHRAAPFHSLEFPLVVPVTSKLQIEADDLPKRGLRLLADGRPLRRVTTIRIRDAGRRVRLLRLEEHRFIETLSRKFIGESDVPATDGRPEVRGGDS